MEDEIKNLYQDQVKIDEKEREKQIRKQIRLYREEYKRTHGAKPRKKALINRFSSKIKITL